MTLKRNMAMEKCLDLGTNSELTCMVVGGVWRERNQMQAEEQQSETI